MHTYVAADRAFVGFLDWIAEFEPPKPPCTQHDFSCLFDFFQAWLDDGTAVEDCCQDFQTFLTAVTLIIAQWHEGLNPKEDYPEMSRIVQISDPEHFSYGVLSPDRFIVAREDFRAQQAQLYGCRLPRQS